MSQTSYSIDTAPVGFPGQRVDLAQGDVISAIGETALKYGSMAVRGAASSEPYRHLAKEPAAAVDLDANDILGVVLADQGREQVSSVTDPQYPIKSQVPLMREGRVWVAVVDAVTKGEAVHVSYDTGTEGEFGSTSLINSVLVAGLRFMSAAGAGEYAMLEVDLI